MIKILQIVLLLSALVVRGQIEFEKFDELLISDFGNQVGKSFVGYSYLIKLKETPIRGYCAKVLRGVDLLAKLKTVDSVRYQQINSLPLDSIQKVREEMDKLRREFKEPETIESFDEHLITKLEKEIIPFSRWDILSSLMITRDSINKNLEKYIVQALSRKKIKYKQGELNYCMEKLSDFKLFEKTAITMTKGSGTDNFRTVALEFRNNSDTSAFYTHGQYPLMLPWMDKAGKEFSYNPNLSKAVGLLLPDKEHSNRDALLMNDKLYTNFYVSELYFKTIETNCINRKNKLIVK